MKTRAGFVSNSSSSSFVCNICGCAESGMDCSASDFDMSECVNGHTWCNEHHNKEDALGPEPEYGSEDHIKWIKDNYYDTNWDAASETEREELLDESWDEYQEYLGGDSWDGVPAHMCPICTLAEILPEDKLAYILKAYNLNEDDIEEAIRAKYLSLEDLHAELYEVEAEDEDDETP